MVRYQNTYVVSGALLVCLAALMTSAGYLEGSFQNSLGRALLGFNPFLHQPPPPAYPLYVGLGKVANFFVHDPLWSLNLLTAAGCVMMFIAVASRFPNVIGFIVAFAVALLFVGRPEPDALAVGLFIWSAAAMPPLSDRAKSGGMAAALQAPLLLAATVGVLPQSIVVVVPYLLIRNWRWLGVFLGGLAVAFLQTVQNIELRRLRAYIESSFEPARVFDPLGVWVIAAIAIAALTYHFVRGQADDLARHPDVQRGGEH